MLTHIVLMKPRPDLSADGRLALVDAFERAIRDIPTVRGVRIGRRVTHGAGYEQTSPDTADYLAVIDFDDLAGLQAYLRHPAHDELGARFGQSLSGALVYDFEVGESGRLRMLAGSRIARSRRWRQLQGFTSDSAWMSEKSFVFLVASVNPPERAIAAICASSTLIGRPTRVLAATMSAYSAAAAAS